MILVLRINLHYKYIFVTRYFNETADPMHMCLSLVVKKSQSCQKYYYGAIFIDSCIVSLLPEIQRRRGSSLYLLSLQTPPSESEKIRSSVV